jgi:hypothetical protein
MTMIRTAAVAAAIIGFGSAGAMAQGMSEPQARSVLLNSCNNVSSLSRDKAGTWHGMCSKGAMMVDRSGNILFTSGASGGRPAPPHSFG